MKDRHYCYSRWSDNMSTSPCGFRPTTGIGYNIAYKTSDRNPNTITTIRGVKARPIRKQGQQMILGYQAECSIIQEYPLSNDLITVSVYSQHVSIPHRECDYGHMIRAHITVPKCSDMSLMEIIEKSVRVLVTCLISNEVTDPCSRPKPTRTSGHVIWSSGIAAMPILHSSDCPTTLCKLQFPEPESDSNSRPMDRVALGCHKGS